MKAARDRTPTGCTHVHPKTAVVLSLHLRHVVGAREQRRLRELPPCVAARLLYRGSHLEVCGLPSRERSYCVMQHLRRLFHRQVEQVLRGRTNARRVSSSCYDLQPERVHWVFASSLDFYCVPMSRCSFSAEAQLDSAVPPSLGPPPCSAPGWHARCAAAAQPCARRCRSSG